MFDAGKTIMIGLPYVEKNYDNMLSRFHLIPERHGQTDGQNCYINIARQCTDAIIKSIASIQTSFNFITMMMMMMMMMNDVPRRRMPW